MTVQELTTDYDVVFIGASPFSLLEASHRKRRGDSVLVLERTGEIGGAWRIETSQFFDATDEAPHIVQPHHGVYDFFENFLNVSMEDITDRAFTITPLPFFGRWVHPYNNWELTDQSSLGHVLRLQIDHERSGARNYDASRQLAARAESAKGPRVKYFTRGAEGLRKGIDELISSIDLTVELNADVVSVQQKGTCVYLEGSFGEVTCRKIIIPTNAQFNVFRFEGLEYTDVNFISENFVLTILLSRSSDLDFEIANFIDHRFLRFVSNASTFSTFAEAYAGRGLGALKVYCRQGIHYSQTLPGAIIYELINLGLVKPNAKILGSEVRLFKRPKIPKSFLDTISAAASGLVTTFATNNLAAVVSRRLPDWRETLAGG